MKLVPFLILTVILCLALSGTPTLAAPRAEAAAPDFSCATATDLPVTECEALVALYSSTNGPVWKTNTGWLTTNTPCSWYGVSCYAGHVTSLSLSHNEMAGTIPQELGDLTELGSLNLYTNALTGPLPNEMGNLTELDYCSLGYNKFTGSIPTSFGKLTNLWLLGLHQNQLTGPIPPELGNLPKLRGLDLRWNQLSGTIPKELGKLSALEDLSLGWNQLTGPIPTELGNLTNLTALSLNENQLTGEIPIELTNLVNLERLYLYSNQLTGHLPPELANLSKLNTLSIWTNQFTGPIPPELGSLSNLEYLSMDENQLSGPIPPELGNLPNLLILNLSYNRLTGTIPSELGKLAKLRSLGLNNNQLTGAIPPEIGNLTELLSLDLDVNQLTGPIPQELGNLVNLGGPWKPTQRSDRVGFDPSAENAEMAPAGGGGRFSGLWLGDNQLAGLIPATLQKLTQLEYMDLSNNRFTGPLPTTLTALPLVSFSFDATDLCEPGDAEFQAWLGGIAYLSRTDMRCGVRALDGIVWDDQNRNGLQDPAEPPVVDVTVTLTPNIGALASIAASRQVVTDSDGSFRFASLEPGGYQLGFASPDYRSIVPGPVAVNVPEDQDVTVPPVAMTKAVGSRLFLPLIRH